MRSRARRVPARRSWRRRSASCSAPGATQAMSARTEARPTSRPSWTYRRASSRTKSSAALAELRPGDEEVWCWHVACSATAARVHTHGDAAPHARIWRRAAERLIAMSGQFEQRRLARPSTSSTSSMLLPARISSVAAPSCAWPGASWRRHGAGTRSRAGGSSGESRLARAFEPLPTTPRGSSPAQRRRCARERERLRHVTELAEGVAAAGEALAPEEGEGASGLIAVAERALAPLERLAPELERAGNELRDTELRLRETASELRAVPCLVGGRAGASRADRVRAGARLPTAKRRFSCGSYDELLSAGSRGASELEDVGRRRRPSPLRPELLPRPGRGSTPWRRSCAPHVRRPPGPSRRPSPRSSAASGWERGSFGWSSVSGRAQPPEPTRRRF